MHAITYHTDRVPNVEQFRSVLNRSGLGERRPVTDADALEKMLRHGNLTATAWIGEELIGVARSVTDFSFCCYLSDLAVDRRFQRQGIGKELMRLTGSLLDSGCTLILLAAPAAVSYYNALGLPRHQAAFVFRPADQ